MFSILKKKSLKPMNYFIHVIAFGGIILCGAVTSKAVFHSTIVKHQWICSPETTQQRKNERENLKEREINPGY